MRPKDVDALQAELSAMRAAEPVVDLLGWVGPWGPELELSDGRRVLHFASHDTLGLWSHAEVVAAASEAVRSHGTGTPAGGPCLEALGALQNELARFARLERAWVGGGAGQAQRVALSALTGPDDVVVIDGGSGHALQTAVRGSGARVVAASHNDLTAVVDALGEARRAGCRRLMLATDGVFPDGTLARLAVLCDIARDFDAWTCVDDRLGVGVVGVSGGGSCEHWGVAGRVDVLIGEFSHALSGVPLGFVAGAASVVGVIEAASRGMHRGTPSMVAAAHAALRVSQGDADPRHRAETLAESLADGVAGGGFDVRYSGYPIVRVALPQATCRAVHGALFRRGVLAACEAGPGQPGLRFHVMADHTPGHVRRVAAVLGELGQQMGVLA